MKQSTSAAEVSQRARNIKRKWAELKKLYEIRPRRAHFELWCRNCTRGFRLDKAELRRGGRGSGVGRLVHLFNHAIACRFVVEGGRRANKS